MFFLNVRKMFFGLEMAVLRVFFLGGVLYQCYKIPGNMEGHVLFFFAYQNLRIVLFI